MISRQPRCLPFSLLSVYDMNADRKFQSPSSYFYHKNILVILNTIYDILKNIKFNENIYVQYVVHYCIILYRFVRKLNILPLPTVNKSVNLLGIFFFFYFCRDYISLIIKYFINKLLFMHWIYVLKAHSLGTETHISCDIWPY